MGSTLTQSTAGGAYACHENAKKGRTGDFSGMCTVDEAQANHYPPPTGLAGRARGEMAELVEGA
jgi:hypothetical protein